MCHRDANVLDQLLRASSAASDGFTVESAESLVRLIQTGTLEYPEGYPVGLGRGGLDKALVSDGLRKRPGC